MENVTLAMSSVDKIVMMVVVQRRKTRAMADSNRLKVGEQRLLREMETRALEMLKAEPLSEKPWRRQASPQVDSSRRMVLMEEIDVEVSGAVILAAAPAARGHIASENGSNQNPGAARKVCARTKA